MKPPGESGKVSQQCSPSLPWVSGLVGGEVREPPRTLIGLSHSGVIALGERLACNKGNRGVHVRTGSAEEKEA
jgi:hypothetical protein